MNVSLGFEVKSESEINLLAFGTKQPSAHLNSFKLNLRTEENPKSDHMLERIVSVLLVIAV